MGEDARPCRPQPLVDVKGSTVDVKGSTVDVNARVGPNQADEAQEETGAAAAAARRSNKEVRRQGESSDVKPLFHPCYGSTRLLSPC
eukprot:828739-Prorocentrum_minimum.AAC.1